MNSKNFIQNKLLLILLIFSYLLIGCEKEISTSPADEDIPQAFLLVDSKPAGSSIYLNGKNSGRKTPGYIPFLESGLYQVALKKKYFRDTTFSVTLIEKDTSRFFIDYFQNPLMLGRIYFSSSPTAANIYLNDSSTGLKTSSLISSLPPGTYNVKYKLYNHRDSGIKVIVESNKTVNSYAQMRDTSTWIDYQITNSGIQSNLLTSIAVDNNNFKWIGTSNSGVISFDESEFEKFSTTNSGIPSNQINCINISNDNRIWIGTNNGLAVFNRSSWQVFRVDNSGLTNNNINAIEFDNNGAAWIGTNNGFIKFDGTNWQQFNYTSTKFTYLWVTSLKFDNQNNLWIGSNNFGILKFDGSTFTEYIDTMNNFLTNRISTIALDNTGKLWFGQLLNTGIRGGISIFNGSAFTNLYLGTINNKVNRIHSTGGIKWVSTSEGLARYDQNNNSTFFSTLNSYLSNDNVTGCVKDNQGNLWITTFGGGLNKLKNQ